MFSPLCVSYKDTCHWMWGHPVNPGWSNLKMFNHIPSAKTHFPNKITVTMCGDKGVDMSLSGGHHPASFYSWQSLSEAGGNGPSSICDKEHLENNKQNQNKKHLALTLMMKDWMLRPKSQNPPRTSTLSIQHSAGSSSQFKIARIREKGLTDHKEKQ